MQLLSWLGRGELNFPPPQVGRAPSSLKKLLEVVVVEVEVEEAEVLSHPQLHTNKEALGWDFKVVEVGVHNLNKEVDAVGILVAVVLRVVEWLHNISNSLSPLNIKAGVGEEHRLSNPLQQLLHMILGAEAELVWVVVAVVGSQCLLVAPLLSH